MKFTGERIVPGKVNADLLNEHFCRYWFAQLLVEGKAVLDMGSGAGYGSQILAAKASSVVAVDLSEEAVRYARKKYSGPNIYTVVGDGCDLPLARDSVDVIIDFELIEHLKKQRMHLVELNRVLRSDGFLIISTPNRTFYTEESNQVNPFHTQEFDLQEFISFLKSTFSCVQLYFQNHLSALFIGNPALVQEAITQLEENSQDVETTSNYFVAICSHHQESQPLARNFCLLPSTGNLLREQQQSIKRLEKRVWELDSVLTKLQREHTKRTDWSLQLERQVEQRDQVIDGLVKEFESRSGWAHDLEGQVKEKGEVLLKLQAEFDDRTRWAHDLEGQVNEKGKVLLKLQAEFDDRNKVLLKLQAEFDDRNNELEQLKAKLEVINQSIFYKLGKALKFISPI